MRAWLIVAVLIASTAPAHAGVLVVSGDDIEHIRDLNSERAHEFGYPKLGYRYERWGVVLDIWRWGGEFVVYEGETYTPLTDDDLAALGNPSVPWRYRIPSGLLVLLGLVELAILLRLRRNVKALLIAGTILVALSGAFVLLGLTWEFLIPLVLGLHHLLTGWLTIKRTREEAELAAASQPHMKAMTSSGAHRVSPSGSHRAVSQSGQHRASNPAIARTSSRDLTTSQSGQHRVSSSGAHRKVDDSGSMVPSRPSQPIIVQRPTTEPTAPIKPDDSVDGPKLLR